MTHFLRISYKTYKSDNADYILWSRWTGKPFAKGSQRLMHGSWRVPEGDIPTTKFGWLEAAKKAGLLQGYRLVSTWAMRDNEGLTLQLKDFGGIG